MATAMFEIIVEKDIIIKDFDESREKMNKNVFLGEIEYINTGGRKLPKMPSFIF